jgi:CHAT domain-containing protein
MHILSDSKQHCPVAVFFVLLLGMGVLPPLGHAQNAAPATPTNDSTEDLLSQARNALKAKDPSRALRLLDRQLAAKRDDGIAHQLRGAALAALDRLDEAASAYRRATAVAPNMSANWNGLCWALILANGSVEARLACEKAVALDANDWAARVNLGHTFLLVGDAAMAQQHYREVLWRINTDKQLSEGPIADFDIFIAKGWQLQSSNAAKAWFQIQWPRWQSVVALTREVIRLSNAGQFQAALAPSSEAARLSAEVLGAEHPQTGIRVGNLSQTYSALTDYPRALPLAERALAIAEKAQGAEHPSTGNRLNNLAGLYKSMGQYDKALPLYQRALAIAEKAEGADHPSTGISLNNLAELYKSMGQYDKALPLYQGALAIAEKAEGAEHPSTGTSLNNLATLYASMGQYDKALPLYQRALAIAEKAEGAEHPSTGAHLNNLAELYDSMGQYDKALPLYQRALAIAEKAQGAEHPSTGTRLNNLATLYASMGQYDKALPLYQRALAIAEKAQGAEHPSTGISLNNLAELYKSMGQYDKALPLYQRALAIAENAEGAEHPSTGISLNNLAGLYESMGQYGKALPLYQRALAIAEKAQGAEHPSTGTRLNNLAGLYESMGQYDKALPLYQRALAIAEKAQGAEHPSTGTHLNNLAGLYESMGQYDKALPLSQRALAIGEKAQGAEHPSTGAHLNNLAGLYRSMGQYDKALPLYRRALAIVETAGQPELAWTLHANLMQLFSQRRSTAPDLYQPDLAIWYGKQAINTLQSVRGGMKSLDKDLQQSFLKQNERTYNILADLLIEAGRIAEAEQVLAMLKQSELSELTRSTAAPRTQADFVGVERRALEEQRRISVSGVKDAAELAQLEKRSSDLTAEEQARLQALRTAALDRRAEYQRFLSSLGQLFARSGRTGAEKEAKTEATRLQTKVALDAAGAMGLHYVVTDTRVSIIVATPRESFGRFSDISRADLNKLIAAMRAAIRSQADTRPAAHALWLALIAPVQADIQAAGAKTIVLSLTDTLRYLPFAALQDADGRYLVQDFALSLWAAAADVNPAASQQAWNVAGLGLTQARPGFPALGAVRSELQGIVRTAGSPGGLLPGSIALDEQFGRAQFDAALQGQNNVVHIASHFDFRPGDESRSVLLLGKADETLSLGQLAVMNFSRVDLLTLSACETAVGGGTNENGAEVEGLAAAVLDAKAQAVLATLWKVADDSTASLMRAFYAQRMQGPQATSRAQALRQAQLALLTGTVGGAEGAAASATARGAKSMGADAQALGKAPVDPARPWAHPYFWAPFVLSGNWL